MMMKMMIMMMMIIIIIGIFISNLLLHYKIPITTLGHKWVSEEEARRYGYTHLISQSKRKKEIEIKVKNRLKKEIKHGTNPVNV